MTELVIDRFEGQHRFLSNFHPSPIVLVDGRVAPTVEHAYQAYKTSTLSDDFARVLATSTPGAAKRLGQLVRLRPDWESVKLDVMRRLLTLKFPLGGHGFSAALLGTGDALLVEGNAWGDDYWGVASERGLNWLGHLLMARRAELRAVVDGRKNG